MNTFILNFLHIKSIRSRIEEVVRESIILA